MGFVARVCQPSTLRMLICPEASSAQNNIAAVSADGSTVWVLIRRLNSSWSRPIALVVRALFHWLGGSRVKGKEPITGLLEAVGYRLAFESPFVKEGPAALFDLGRRGGVDHVVVVGRNLVVQPRGGVGEQIAMLVDGAALGRHIAPQSSQRLLQPSPAIDNQELRLAQLALDEVVEDGAPGVAGLATHILVRQQHLLGVL